MLLEPSRLGLLTAERDPPRAPCVGYNPSPEGQLLPPPEFMVTAMGVKQDHIVHGIIYGKSFHPLMRAAIQHAFGRKVFAAKIFCKFLWTTLTNDMGGVTPKVRLNITKTFGPIYLFLEKRSGKQNRSKIHNNEGHYLEGRAT